MASSKVDTKKARKQAEASTAKKADKTSGKATKSGKSGKAAKAKSAKKDKPAKAEKPPATKKSKAPKHSADDAVLGPVPITTTGVHDWATPPAALLRPGPEFDITELDATATPGWEGDRAAAEHRTAALGLELSELQERLFAQGRTGGGKAVLLVLQGLDTAGKGGIVRHVLGMVDPQGVALHSFGVPTHEEREHHYLWRIERALPPAGRIGVFDRSHYEDVLVVKVDGLASDEEIEGRYQEINDFERSVIERGISIVKVALIVSPQEQYLRLRERLERPDKHWKFSLGDLEVRSKRAAYDAAYQTVLERTSTEPAPWHVVPADSKWYARLVVSELLTQALRDLDLRWPEADFDVAAALAALDADQPPVPDSEA